MILNLTQHPATDGQREDGVVEPDEGDKSRIGDLLTFDDPPEIQEVRNRADKIAEIAVEYDAEQAMIGGAPWLMSALEEALRADGIDPVYAFSERDVVEQENDDGEVEKQTIFRHRGFVHAPTD